VATHADVDHTQGLKAARELLPNAEIVAHPLAKVALEAGDRIASFAEIPMQGISIDFPKVKVDRTVEDGDTLQLGSLAIGVWYTPGHALGQLSFVLGDLLFSGDNVYRDGCVGNIDPHHGSDIPDFIGSLERIRDSDAKWLLPSHGPVFRKDRAMLQKVIDRLTGYLHMADFGTCAVDWPLLKEWESELLTGFDPAKA
jgi:hydroxyacylglutathione hydrolase